MSRKKKEVGELGKDSEFLPQHTMPDVPEGATDAEITSHVAGSSGVAGGLPAVVDPAHKELPAEEEAPLAEGEEASPPEE